MYDNRINNLTEDEAKLIFEHATGFPFKHRTRDVKATVRNYLRAQKKNPDEILAKIEGEKRRQPSCAKSF
jgi:hypothetical protein